MATTTNYGWTTPDDTALVKDGASAIRTLGSSVDTTTKNLNPETTLGDMSFRSSTSNVNTRIPIGSSGQHLTVVAGVPAWATASDQTPLTTKGDLFTFSTVDARLGVGANGTTLVADSSEATGLKWQAPASGALTKITSASFTTQSSVTVDNCFDTTYTRYVILYTINAASSAGLDLQFQWRYGSSTQTTEYYGIQVPTQRAASGTSTVSENAAQLTIYNDLSESAEDTSGLINLNGVGNGSNNPLLWGNQFIASYTGFGNFSGYNNTARDYTGFILKTNSGTMNGQYAVYGYAN